MKSTVTPKKVLLDTCPIQESLEDSKVCKKLREILHSMDAEFFVSTRTLFELAKNLKQNKHTVLKKASELLGIEITIHYTTIAEKAWEQQEQVKFLCHYEDRPILSAAKFQNFILLTADKALRNISNHFGVRAFHPMNGGIA